MLEFGSRTINVWWDGVALWVHGRHKAAQLTLAGNPGTWMGMAETDDEDTDIVVRRDQIRDLRLRNATALVTGSLTIITTDNRAYVLPFERRHRNHFARLAAQLRA